MSTLIIANNYYYLSQAYLVSLEKEFKVMKTSPVFDLKYKFYKKSSQYLYWEFPVCKIPGSNCRTIKKHLFHIRYLFTLNMVMALVRINSKFYIKLWRILINSKDNSISGSAGHVFDIYTFHGILCDQLLLLWKKKWVVPL